MNKKTDRHKRDEDIDKLLDDGESVLDDLLESLQKKHANGGVFKDPEHQKRTRLCIQTIKEEDLE